MKFTEKVPPSDHLVTFFQQQLKVKIRLWRKKLSFEVFTERWMTVTLLVQVNGANLEWYVKGVVKRTCTSEKSRHAHPS